jgi:glycosyltransferase involved in cell wall biosynthesis
LPDITVLLPFHKVNRFLLEAIASVTAQIDDIGELLLVADRVTKDEIRRLSVHVKANPQIRCISSPGSGLVDALNFGVRQAKHKYIARLDSDDLAILGRFRRQEMYLDNHASVALLGTSLRYICTHGKRIGSRKMPGSVKPFRSGGSVFYPIGHPSVMFRRQDAIDVGLYRNIYPHCEDLDLWYRLEEVGQLRNLKMFGIEYRLHKGQVSTVHSKTQKTSSFLIALNKALDPAKFNTKNLLATSISEYRLGSVFAKDNLGGLLRDFESNRFDKLETIYAEMDLLHLSGNFKSFSFSNLRTIVKYIGQRPRRSLTLLRLHLRLSPPSRQPKFARCASCRVELKIVHKV